jgi:hypothetical protein
MDQLHVRRSVAVRLAFILAGALPAAAFAQGTPTPLADDPTLIALAVSLSCANAPEAEVKAPAPSASPRAAGPELELVATVRAKALRFEKVPQVDVTFKGSGPHHTVWKTERVNLPIHPEAGVTYRDVAVRLTITSTIDELAQLLSKAKRASRGIEIEPEDPPATGAAAPVEPAAVPAAATPAAVSITR